jgi:hypothetical protein
MQINNTIYAIILYFRFDLRAKFAPDWVFSRRDQADRIYVRWFCGPRERARPHAPAPGPAQLDFTVGVVHVI